MVKWVKNPSTSNASKYKGLEGVILIWIVLFYINLSDFCLENLSMSKKDWGIL